MEIIDQTFINEDFSGQDFSDYLLKGCTFRGCEFSNTSFKNARFENMVISGSKLVGENINLNGTDFINSMIIGVKLSGIKFSNVNLLNTSVYNSQFCYLTSKKFRIKNGVIANTRFCESEMFEGNVETEIQDLTLEASTLDYSQFYNVKGNGVKIINPKSVAFNLIRYSSLVKTEIFNGVIKRCSLNENNFLGSKLLSVKFEECQGKKSIFDLSNLDQTDLGGLENQVSLVGVVN